MTITLADVVHWADVYLLPIGLKILFAVILFVVGRGLTRAVLRALDRLMERSKMDISLRKFLGDVAYAVLFVVVIVAALDTVGVKTTAVVAVLGAAGLAVGLALQGSLSNFAAGVMLIVLRPYKVADLVIIGKYTGRVDAIKVFNTFIVTADNREITIPNGQIIAAPIENLTVLGRRRLDLIVSIDQKADLAQIRTLLAGVLHHVEDVPSPKIEICEITDVLVKLQVRPWTTCDNYAATTAETMERIKTALDGTGMKYAVAVQGGA
ncbi:small-conductance mechanosensitive channel MscS [soil metagenome]